MDGFDGLVNEVTVQTIVRVATVNCDAEPFVGVYVPLSVVVPTSLTAVGATVKVWVESFQVIQDGRALPSDKTIELAAYVPVVAQPACPEAKHRSNWAFEDRALVSETGAGTVGFDEAFIATVAVTGVGAVQAIAVQLHVVGFIVT